MKYSYNWLQQHIVEPLPSVEALEQKIIFHAFEVEDKEVVGTDTILEIKVLPDRAGDCLSHVGMAREIAGLLGLTFKHPSVPALHADLSYPVVVDSPACTRYSALKIERVTVGPSPEWLKARLESVGQKSINNIVDATNFILLDTGQPTHAFDADKIEGGIQVRMARHEETITTLSGETKTLLTNDLVIADATTALAIAGVKGGVTAEVTISTKNIVLEIAGFDPTAIRKTSRKLGLVTDASKRFENNLSPIAVENAARALGALILEIAGGTLTATTDYYPAPLTTRTLTFSTLSVTAILGSTITEQDIQTVFDRYGYEYTFSGQECTLSVPWYRADITGAHDIAEEVGRVVGYDRIPAVPLPFTPVIRENLVDSTLDAVRKHLIEKGYSEVMNYTFRKKGDVYVAYGARDKSALRTNLADGLKESYELNLRNAPVLGVKDTAIFEIGTVFFASHEEVHVAIADKAGVQEFRIPDFVEKNTIETSGAHITAGASSPVPFRPWSAYPFIVRDIAVWLPEGDTSAKDVLDTTVQEFARTHAVRDAVMFDSFSKEGRTSYAYRLVFQSYEKTLTDTEVMPLIDALSSTIASIPGALVR